MKVKYALLVVLVALMHCRKPDRPEQLTFRDGFVVGNDTTPPQVVSVTGEAGTNQLLVEFTEPVYTTSTGTGDLVLADFGYQDNNATGTSSLATMFEANGGDKVVVLITNANLIAGDNGDRVTFPANSIYDAAGNALAATDKLIVLTIVPPTLTGAETMDTNRNGKIDHLKLTFNKNLNDATFPNYVNPSTLGGVTAAWLVSGFSNMRIDPTLAADVDNDNIIYITWDEGAIADTALKPDLTTTGAPALQASNGATVNQIVSATISETDAAPPVLIDATEKAGEKDLVLSFSEPVYTNNNATGNLVLGDFGYTNSNPTGATVLSSVTEADGSDKSITIQMDALYVNGDHSTDRIAVVSNEVYDAIGLAAVNCLTGTHCNDTYITTRITSGDSPILQSAETMDIDGNGKIDHYKLTFDVPVNDSTFPGHAGNNALGTVTTQWLIAGRSNVRIDTRDAAPPTGPGDSVTNDNTIYLAFDESTNACAGNDISGCDSGAKPDITTTATPGLTDLDPTNFPQLASGGIVETDKATPKLITLKGHGNATSLVAYFSEAVFTSTGATGDLIPADFSYQNDNTGGATAVTGLTEANGGDGKVTLTTSGSFVIGDDNADDLVAATNAIYDAGDNVLVATTPIRVVPLLLSAETMDIDSDGTIDHYKLTFSMPVDDSTFPGYAGDNTLGSVTTEWLVAGQANVRIDTRDAAPPNGPGDSGTNDAAVYLEYSGISKTDSMPNLTTTITPGFRLLGGTTAMNQLNTTDITEQDKAPPIVSNVFGGESTTTLSVRFSEPVYSTPGAGFLQVSDFAYSDGNSGMGATGLSAMGVDADGSDLEVSLLMNAAFVVTDFVNADTLSILPNEIFDSAGNPMVSVSKYLLYKYQELGKPMSMAMHSCAIKHGGTLTCWGDNTYGQTTIPTLTAPTQATSGLRHTCALHSPGGISTVTCWGSNSDGQTTVPSLVAPTAVASGQYHVCALHYPGGVASVACWGRNTLGQTSVPALTNPSKIASGRAHSCALHSPSSVPTIKCWGYNGNAQTTVPALTNPTEIAIGDSHSCAIHNPGGIPSVQCWGSNSLGQTTVPSLTNPTRLASGYSHLCALEKPAGIPTVTCWGDNANNQTSVPVLSNPIQISLGSSHSCALHNDVFVICWGRNDFSQATPPP